MSQRSSLRPVSVAGAAQALLLLGLFVLVSGTVLGELFAGIIAGCAAFLVWRFGLVRVVLLRHLRKGTRQAQAGLYSSALKSFALSAQAWEGRRWLDSGRGVLLGSAARWPFRALSRYNQAWCLAKLGHLAEAQVVLQSLVRDQPKMGVAEQLLSSLGPAPEAAAVPEAWPALDTDPAWTELFGEDVFEDEPMHDEPTLDPQGPDAG